MKNVKITTRVIGGFIILGLMIVVLLYFGYTTAATVIKVDDPEHYLQSYATFTAIIFIVALIVIIAISVGISRDIRISLSALKGAAQQLAAGKVDVKIDVTGKNEFAELAAEYQKVADNIRYQSSIAEEVASGNLTVEVVPRSEEDVLGHSLKKLVQQNFHALTIINEEANQVMTSASQVASASEALAQGSTEQASAIEEITASISDIAGKTKQNAAEANDASELVAQAIQEVVRGNDQMKDMMVAMKEINAASESISKIIKVIDDIAFQTNILALNAAVEAARAGEAGKGFAVVAEEVRNLAAKSSAAASETAELIEDSMHKVESGSQIAEETAKALESMTDVVTRSETMIHNITDASNYQATAIAQVDQAIEQVSQVVQNNSATSEECAAASVELSGQAGRMKERISVYRLGNNYSTGTTPMATQGYSRNEQSISLGEGFGKY
jgi:methyl-accepting chemotaxis protein